MAKRLVCDACQRPEKTCICGCAQRLPNQLKWCFLQHPSEVKEAKGSLTLARLCLPQAQWFVGEVFEAHHPLWAWLASKTQVYLLYPPTQEFSGELVAAECLGEALCSPEIGVLVLDGTWRKTRKMLFLNPRLAQLARLSITPNAPSRYQIRKEPSLEAISTLEAIAHVHHCAGEYATAKALNRAFDAFIEIQKTYRPR